MTKIPPKAYEELKRIHERYLAISNELDRKTENATSKEELKVLYFEKERVKKQKYAEVNALREKYQNSLNKL